MDFMEVFLEYLENKITIQMAEMKIKKILSTLIALKNARDYAKASLCLTYFKRYNQYNSGQIGAKDLLLFIRDFVLFLGRFPFPRLITDVVSREGSALGIFVASDGAVDVIDNIPKSLEDNKQFIWEVYQFGKEGEDIQQASSGDKYVNKYSYFSSYRSLEQKISVHSAIELPDNHTLMISLPTGGGKSLVTQLLASFEQKLTIVIVPTVSLAKDQYLQARECIADEEVKKGIFCFRSDSDNGAMMAGIEKQTVRLIFTSPEAILKNSTFNNSLRKAAEEQFLHNVIIDEAHIVPDWGVNFRPDFQIFSVVLRELRTLSKNKIRTYLLSATLSDDVVDVLFELFGSGENNVEFRCDALRSEPRYIISENRSYDKREKEVIEMVKFLPKPLIVYVIEPSIAERYCKLLRADGFSNVHTYTGGTNDKDRESLLEKWKNNDFDVMIATSAFGMGVDKSNVRTIIHACIPESLSRFYQEVGRAGRDGLPSLSVLSYYISKDDGRNDLTVAWGLVKRSILTKEKLLIRLESILSDDRNVIEGDIITADLNTVPASFTIDEAERAGKKNMCWNASTLLLLRRQGYIDIISASYDTKNQTYLFTFKIKDIDLLHDKEKLTEVLSEDRQHEYDMRVEGYQKMAGLIHRPKAKCWGKQFVSLYPFARPICSGCPVHPKGTAVKEDIIRIRKDSFVNIKPDEPGRLLRRYMGVLKNMLIPVEDYNALDIHVVAEKADKMKLACFVFPDTCEAEISTECMSLRHSEFLVVAEKVPWLLRNGIMILLCENNSINNKVFEAANRGMVKEYRKVWCSKLNTKIVSRNRTINEFLNCHTCNLTSI